MQYLGHKAMTQQNPYSANLEKMEARRNRNHPATSEGTMLQGPNPLRRRTSKSNLLPSIDQGMRQNAPHRKSPRLRQPEQSSTGTAGESPNLVPRKNTSLTQPTPHDDDLK